MSTIVDLTTDKGYEVFVGLLKEGKLELLKKDTDIDLLLQKQAYASADSYADPIGRMFSIGSPQEAYISARYAEKCASDVSEDIIAKINEACLMFSVPVTVEKVAAVKVANEMFPEQDKVSIEKYAGVSEYGTEFEAALTARIMTLPEHEEDYQTLAKLASTIPANQMVDILREVDSRTGADLPWVTTHVGTPEYAVFEKRSSLITVDLCKKSVPFEKLAELQDAMNDMGITIDFDENDAYTTKLAIERLPVSVRRALADMV